MAQQRLVSNLFNLISISSTVPVPPAPGMMYPGGAVFSRFGATMQNIAIEMVGADWQEIKKK